MAAAVDNELINPVAHEFETYYPLLPPFGTQFMIADGSTISFKVREDAKHNITDETSAYAAAVQDGCRFQKKSQVKCLLTIKFASDLPGRLLDLWNVLLVRLRKLGLTGYSCDHVWQNTTTRSQTFEITKKMPCLYSETRLKRVIRTLDDYTKYAPGVELLNDISGKNARECSDRVPAVTSAKFAAHNADGTSLLRVEITGPPGPTRDDLVLWVKDVHFSTESGGCYNLVEKHVESTSETQLDANTVQIEVKLINRSDSRERKIARIDLTLANPDQYGGGAGYGGGAAAAPGP